MGKRQKREPTPEAEAEAEPPPPAAGAGAGAEEQPQSGRRSRLLVNAETATYLEEILAHFQTLVDDEERALLVANVLEEIDGKESKVAGDPVCSRHVETLMAAAQPDQALKFMSAVAGDEFFTLVSSPFGSHVVEKLLVRLEGQLDAMSEEEYASFEGMLKRLTGGVCPHLYDYVTDRYATHVVRRLLCSLAGRNVLPPPGKQRQQQQQQQLPGLANKRSRTDAPQGLAARLGPQGATGGHGRGAKGAAAALASDLLGTGADEPPPCRFPDQVAQFVAVVCSDEYTGATVSELVYHTYASPFVQALLRAAASDRKAVRQLVPCLLGATTFNDSVKAGPSAALESVREEEVGAMLEDPTTSHLCEVILQVLPGTVVEEFVRRFIAPRLPGLAHHASANYVLQAALAAAPSKTTVKLLYDALELSLADLLRKRRSGVVVALAAACGRHGVCQRELCAALATGLRGLPQWAHLQGDAALAPALLCLDAPPVVGANEPLHEQPAGSGAPRLSPAGCSILIQVLQYGQGACRAFTDSVAGLQPHDAARVGADPSGSRVLEALLGGNAPPKVKAQLLASLAGHWEVVASTGSGSFLVEAAYRNADMDVKEAIVQRLAGAVRSLEGTHWGPALLRTVGADSYARDPGQWRRHAASASRTLDQFSKLFGSGSGDGHEHGKRKGKASGEAKGEAKGQGGKDKEQGGDEGKHAGGAGAEGGAEPARKRKKGPSSEQEARPEGTQKGPIAQEEEEEEDAGRKERKKAKKQRRLEEAAAAAAEPSPAVDAAIVEGGGEEGARKRKKPGKGRGEAAAAEAAAAPAQAAEEEGEGAQPGAKRRKGKGKQGAGLEPESAGGGVEAAGGEAGGQPSKAGLGKKREAEGAGEEQPPKAKRGRDGGREGKHGEEAKAPPGKGTGKRTHQAEGEAAAELDGGVLLFAGGLKAKKAKKVQGA